MLDSKKDQLVTFTEVATKKLQEVMKEQGSENSYLRVSINETPNGGFEYVFDFLEHQPAKDDDIVLDYGKFFIHIDPVSAPYLDGLTLDHTRNGLNEGFEFFNPNVKNTCGCGVSVTF